MNLKEYKKIGILGGGQLGMFLCHSAKKFQKEIIIYSESHEFSAKKFANKYFIGKYLDFERINNFLKCVDIVTVETENIPLKTLKYIEKKKKLLPDSSIIEIAQNRKKEKAFLNSLQGIRTTNYKPIQSYSDLLYSLNYFNGELIIKSCEQGYDGKNQYYINNTNHHDFIDFSFKHYIAEEIVRFKKEISVIVFRDKYGKIMNYPPVENDHKENILSETIFPARISDKISERAINYAKKIISSLNMNGLLAVEMFLTQNNNLVINEIAPRPHNSGHWTMDGCDINQFDNLLLSICGYKISKPKTVIKRCKMINIIGEEYNNKKRFKDYKFYDYYKKKVLPKRKMGHLLKIIN